MTESFERYGKWKIYYDPKPIPTRKFDYSFVHDDYDEAPGPRDNRAGTAGSIEEAKEEIGYIESEWDPKPLTAEEEGVIDRAYERLRLLEAARALGALLGTLYKHETHPDAEKRAREAYAAVAELPSFQRIYGYDEAVQSLARSAQ